MRDKPFIKICGITQLEDAEFAISSGADAIGFIAYPKSPRFITGDAVKKICSALTADNKHNCINNRNIKSENYAQNAQKEIPNKNALVHIKKVGVFVDADVETIENYLDAGINTIQLHGNENAEFAEYFHNIEIWKAIKPEFNIDVLRFIDFPAQKILLDAFHKILPGGTGITVDRELAEFAIDCLPVPVILAGGINPANFAQIVNEVKPYGMDINSGVEISPGIKDHKKIRELFDIFNKINQVK